jgi:NAD(P)-dependent dehydrogenase (short-subunit alcohol dehydrogenase family)
VRKVVGERGLDILVNNIGLGQGPSRPEETMPEMLREVFEVNVIGTQVVTLAFLPLLRAGKKKVLVNVYRPISWTVGNGRSTLVASLTYNDGRYPWKATGYGVSKAALNFLTTDYAKDLKDEGFIVVALYPGVQIWGVEMLIAVGENASGGGCYGYRGECVKGECKGGLEFDSGG